jgi:leucyl-tRNA synthetase
MVTKHSPQSGRIEKMSKSRGNVVGTTDFFKKFGADAARLFTLFAAPPEQELEWSEEGAIGQYKFLGRVWRLVADLLENKIIEPDKVALGEYAKLEHNQLDASSKRVHQLVHKTIKAVSRDLDPERYIFNTAIARCMELVNELYKFVAEVSDNSGNGHGKPGGSVSAEQKAVLLVAVKNLLLLLAPMAPHLAEELWEKTGLAKQTGKSVHVSPWPAFVEAFTIDREFELVLQVNGKLVSRVSAPLGLSEAEAREIALKDAKVQSKVNGHTVRKVIYVPNKLVNVVIDISN